MNLFTVSRLALPAALLSLLAMAAAGWAVSTSYWEVQRPDQFNQGTPDGVSIHSDGKVTLGPAIGRLAETGESFVWSLAVLPDGGIFAGTGNNGKIIRITGDESETVWQDDEELEILSMIVGPNGHLYAGTSPGGKILRISPRGQTELFFDTAEKHVWSMAFDDKGRLYAGTGPEGKIFVISGRGQGELFYDTKETNITALVWRGQHLFAGGSGNGLIYKFDRSGEGMMVFDAEEEEICGLIFGTDGQLYAAATSGERPISRPPAPEKGQQKEENSGENAPEGGFFMEEPPNLGEFGMQFTGPSTLYRIDGFGSGQPLWQAPEGAMIFSLSLGTDGNLLVGTGDEGRIFSVNPDGDWSLLAEVDETQILALQNDGQGGVLAGTGNPGSVYRLGKDFCRKGTLESPVHDAVIASRWGRITWEGLEPSGTQVTLTTRSGNSETPDETWSSWSAPYERAEGEPIQSPAARFIQWRINLSTTREERTPSVEKVWLAYLQKNMAPVIQVLYVHPPGSENGSDMGSSQRGGGKSGFADGGPSDPGETFGVTGGLATGVRKVSWLAADPNGDDLISALSFRAQGEENWKLLKDDLTASSYSWDSNLFPDGIYRLKLEVSDRPAHPEQQALGSEQVSDPFVVDNTSPQVEVEGKREGEGRYRISGTIKDRLSPIIDLWYSLDAEEWKPLSVSDDVFDDIQEEFSFAIDQLAIGEHIVVIRAMDQAGNVGVGKAVVK